jgi:hypothetical protein
MEVSSYINYLEDIAEVEETNSLTDANQKLIDVKEIVGEDKRSYFRGNVNKYQNKKQTNNHRTQLYKACVQINISTLWGHYQADF